MTPSRDRTPRVVVTDGVADDLDVERSLLAECGAEVALADSTAEDDVLRALAPGADAMLVCYAQIGARVVEAAAAAGCRIIARSGIGVDNIDLDAATRHGIPVTNVPDYCADEVADHTLAVLLSVVRGVVAGHDEVRAGGWSRPLDLQRLRGRRLALLGVGRIGRGVAARARAFGYEVVGFDPHADPWPDDIEQAPTAAAAVSEADAVSLHAPLTPETRHLVDADLIAAMRRRPVLVNTARGGLVELAAVTSALDDGRLGGVALDVTEPEPLRADHPLRRHPRAIVTPHMAFFSVQAEEELRRRATGEIVRALRGQRPERIVNDALAGAGA
jgi:D-3-phosphoglycerate dehydrogenase